MAAILTEYKDAILQASVWDYKSMAAILTEYQDAILQASVWDDKRQPY